MNVAASWRAPLQPTASVLLEFTSADRNEQQVVSAPVDQSTDLAQQTELAIEASGLSQEQWCVRAKAIGPAPSDGLAKASDWSNPFCKTRRADNSIVEYLPWPEVRPVAASKISLARAADVIETYQGQHWESQFLLLNFGAYLGGFDSYSENGVGEQGGQSCVGFVDQERATELDLLLNPICRSAGRAQIDALFDKPKLIYRQGRTAEGELSRWVQVTPMLPALYWEDSLFKKGEYAGAPRFQLNDPYFKVYRPSWSLSVNDTPWILAFVDRYPHRQGYDYRYQIISFNDDMKIVKRQSTDWITAGGTQ
jgi:hypothetical protein